jgi:hypothetical protein
MLMRERPDDTNTELAAHFARADSPTRSRRAELTTI